MYADFISADFGYLRLPDGSMQARKILRPGKNRDGYFTNEDIIAQAKQAAIIVKQQWPNIRHVFIYDNASTHAKRPDGALSARKMPKYTSKRGQNWLVERNKIHPITRQPMRHSDGLFVKERIPMDDTINPCMGQRQALYYSADHPRSPSLFKGMAQLLIERGFDPQLFRRHGTAGALRANCPGFKCVDTSLTSRCCTRCILYNEPDFRQVISLLELAMQQHDIAVIFLPKFHCELNPIEQCWGYAKRIYRLNPDSSKQEALEANALAAVESVPLSSMRK